jgi:AcrR family transcriptional regulator
MAGLRERKRIAAMRRIQEVALDLFDARGFVDVSVEEIAEAADVSPSSVYRYFGTKEQLVLYDEVDVRFVDALRTELGERPPVEAVRHTISGLMAELFDRDDDLARRKVRYVFEEPALRAASLEMTDAFVPGIAAALAEASGRSAEDLDVQVIAAAIVWSLIAAVRHWHVTGSRRPLADELDDALAVIDGGLVLEPRASGGAAPSAGRPAKRSG